MVTLAATRTSEDRQMRIAKTLAERARELKDAEERPSRRADQLSDDVNSYCRSKNISGQAKADFDTVDISYNGKNLRLKASEAGDGWIIDGALPPNMRPGHEVEHDEALDIILAFLPPH